MFKGSKIEKFSIRKFKIGVASAVIATSLLASTTTVLANENESYVQESELTNIDSSKIVSQLSSSEAKVDINTNLETLPLALGQVIGFEGDVSGYDELKELVDDSNLEDKSKEQNLILNAGISEIPIVKESEIAYSAVLETRQVPYKVSYIEKKNGADSTVQTINVPFIETISRDTTTNAVTVQDKGINRDSVMKYVLSSAYDFENILFEDSTGNPYFHDNAQHIYVILRRKEFDFPTFLKEIETKTPEERYIIATSAESKYTREFNQDELNAINAALDKKLYNQEAVRKVNEERVKVGAGTLTVDDELAQGAVLRATEQAETGYFRSKDTNGDGIGDQPHTRPNGDYFNTAFNYLTSVALRSENAGQHLHTDIRELISEKWNAENQVKKFLTSPSHKENMLDRRWTLAHFAMAFSDDHLMIVDKDKTKSKTDINDQSSIFMQVFGVKRSLPTTPTVQPVETAEGAPVETRGIVNVKYVKAGTTEEIIPQVEAKNDVVKTSQKYVTRRGTTFVSERTVDTPTNVIFDTIPLKQTSIQDKAGRVYEFVGKVSGEETGTLKEGVAEVVYEYVLKTVETKEGDLRNTKKGNVVVKYVNQEGKEIKSSINVLTNAALETIQGYVTKSGEVVISRRDDVKVLEVNYDTVSKRETEVSDRDGKVYVFSKVKEGAEQGKVEEGTTTVVYEYALKTVETKEGTPIPTKVASLVVEFVDEQGQKIADTVSVKDNIALETKQKYVTKSGDVVISERTEVLKMQEAYTTIGLASPTITTKDGHVYDLVGLQEGIEEGNLQEGSHKVVYKYALRKIEIPIPKPEIPVPNDKGSGLIQETKPSISLETSKGSGLIQETKPSISLEASKGSGLIQETKPSISLETSKGSGLIQETKPSISLEASKGSGLIQETKPSISLETSKGSGLIQETKPSISLEASNGSGLTQETKPSISLEASNGSGLTQETKLSISLETSKGSGLIQETKPKFVLTGRDSINSILDTLLTTNRVETLSTPLLMSKGEVFRFNYSEKNNTYTDDNEEKSEKILPKTGETNIRFALLSGIISTLTSILIWLRQKSKK